MSSPFGHDTHKDAPPVIPIKMWPKQKAWSYSAVSQHDRCPLAFRFRRIDRLPEPEGAALTRGSAHHAHMAHYIAHGAFMDDAPPELVAAWTDELDKLRKRNAVPEQQLAFDSDWNRLEEWYGNTVWARVVMDVVIATDRYVEVVEWKTGKAYPEHSQQLRLYALAALMAYPEAPLATARVIYLDYPEKDQPAYAALRSALPRLQREFAEFSHKMLNDDMYPAKPGRGCNWCHFRRSNSGPCDHG